MDKGCPVEFANGMYHTYENSSGYSLCHLPGHQAWFGGEAILCLPSIRQKAHKKASSIDCKSSGVFKGAMATHSGKHRDVSTNQHTEMNLGHRAPDKLPIAQKRR